MQPALQTALASKITGRTA